MLHNILWPLYNPSSPVGIFQLLCTKCSSYWDDVQSMGVTDLGSMSRSPLAQYLVGDWSSRWFCIRNMLVMINFNSLDSLGKCELFFLMTFAISPEYGLLFALKYLLAITSKQWRLALEDSSSPVLWRIDPDFYS